MRKNIKSLSMLFIFALIFVIGINTVNGGCYKITKSDGSSIYVAANPNQAMIYEKQGLDVEMVDEKYCQTSSSSTESNNSCYKATIGDGKVSYIKEKYTDKWAMDYKYEEVEEKYCQTSNSISHCIEIDDPKECAQGTKDYSCVWNSKYNFCNTDNLTYVMCGDARDIPSEAPRIISFIITFFKILVPIVLVITSMITLLKALAASKEDEIKKAKTILIRRIIAAALAFFVVSIVQFVISLVASGSERDNFSNCLDCFVNGNCNSNIYYKSNIGSDTICISINGETINCETGKVID